MTSYIAPGIIKTSGETVAFSVTLAEVYLGNAALTMPRLDAKGSGANTLRAGNVMPGLGVSASANIIRYRSFLFEMGTSYVGVQGEIVTANIDTPTRIRSTVTFGEFQASALVYPSNPLIGTLGFEQFTTTGEVYVPTGIRSEASFGNFGIDSDIFIPPYEVGGPIPFGQFGIEGTFAIPPRLTGVVTFGQFGFDGEQALDGAAHHIAFGVGNGSFDVRVQSGNGFPLGASIASRPSYATRTAYSPDGEYLAVAGGGTNRQPQPFVYKRNGSVYTALGQLPGGALQRVLDVSWSHDSKYLACSLQIAPWLVVYRRNADNSFTRLSNIGFVNADITPRIEWHPSKYVLALTYNTGTRIRVCRWAGEQFTALGLTVGTWPNGEVDALAWHPTQDILGFFGRYYSTGLGAPSYRGPRFLRVAADLSSAAIITLAGAPISTNVSDYIRDMAFLDGGRKLVLAWGSQSSPAGGSGEVRFYTLDFVANTMVRDNVATTTRSGGSNIVSMAVSDSGRYIAISDAYSTGDFTERRQIFRRVNANFRYELVNDLGRVNNFYPTFSPNMFSDTAPLFVGTSPSLVSFEAFTAKGQIDQRLSISDDLGFGAFEMVGSAEWEYQINGDAGFPQFTAFGELMPELEINTGMMLPAFTMAGELRQPPLEIEGSFSFGGFDLFGELEQTPITIDDPIGFDAFTALGELEQAGLTIDDAIGFEAFDFLGRVDLGNLSIASPVSFAGFTAVGNLILPYDLEMTATLPEFGVTGEVYQPFVVEANMSFGPFEVLASLEYELLVNDEVGFGAFTMAGSIAPELEINGITGFMPFTVQSRFRNGDLEEMRRNPFFLIGLV